MRALPALLFLACASSPKPPPTTVVVRPPPAADDNNLMISISTGFRVAPKSAEEQASIVSAITSGAAQARLECSRGEGDQLYMCTNVAEIVRRRMVRGNMELYVVREKGNVRVLLIGDGRGQTCRAIRTVRARLSESVATERVKLDGNACP